ncbi:hypothetical protein ZWY2020_054650 [Hordeum vulgare]|nr:hypothetical protein ZWY2020_054650 [Hordeum vulgare]
MALALRLRCCRASPSGWPRPPPGELRGGGLLRGDEAQRRNDSRRQGGQGRPKAAADSSWVPDPSPATTARQPLLRRRPSRPPRRAPRADLRPGLKPPISSTLLVPPAMEGKPLCYV